MEFMTDSRATFSVDIQLIGEFDPVPVSFFEPTDGQIAMIARGAAMAQRSSALAARGVGLILDVIDAMIVEPEQREWMNESMIQGVIDLDNLTGVMSAIRADEDEAAKPPVKKAVRGRR